VNSLVRREPAKRVGDSDCGGTLGTVRHYVNLSEGLLWSCFRVVCLLMNRRHLYLHARSANVYQASLLALGRNA